MVTSSKELALWKTDCLCQDQGSLEILNGKSPWLQKESADFIARA